MNYYYYIIKLSLITPAHYVIDAWMTDRVLGWPVGKFSVRYTHSDYKTASRCKYRPTACILGHVGVCVCGELSDVDQ